MVAKPGAVIWQDSWQLRSNRNAIELHMQEAGVIGDLGKHVLVGLAVSTQSKTRLYHTQCLHLRLVRTQFICTLHVALSDLTLVDVAASSGVTIEAQVSSNSHSHLWGY